MKQPAKIDIVIGIDPDVDKNGFAVLNVKERKFDNITALSFPEMIMTLHASRQVYCGRNFIFLIEAGWLNQGNWHINYRDNKAVIAAKGNHAGRNHEVGRKLAEMCQFWSLPFSLIKPLTKAWKGRDRKITAKELQEITGWANRTNQEMRDAALLAWVWAGMPI